MRWKSVTEQTLISRIHPRALKTRDDFTPSRAQPRGVILPCAGRYLGETSDKRQRRFHQIHFYLLAWFYLGVEIL